MKKTYFHKFSSTFILINRSLQKSKKSIKTIEETMKNSRSIEQWLNDFGKLQMLQKEKSQEKQSSLTQSTSEKEHLVTNGNVASKEDTIKEEEEDELEEMEQEEEENELQWEDVAFNVLMADLARQTNHSRDDLRFKSFLKELVKMASHQNTNKSGQENFQS